MSIKNRLLALALFIFIIGCCNNKECDCEDKDQGILGQKTDSIPSNITFERSNNFFNQISNFSLNKFCENMPHYLFEARRTQFTFVLAVNGFEKCSLRKKSIKFREVNLKFSFL